MKTAESIRCALAGISRYGTPARVGQCQWIVAAVVACVAYLGFGVPLYGQTTIITPTLPTANGWDFDVGLSTGGLCHPYPNPLEVDFLDVQTPSGPGVQFDTISTTAACASCARRTTGIIPLYDPTSGFPITVHMSIDQPHLTGYFMATRSPFDQFSVASLRVDFLLDGILQTSVVFAAEDHPNNNCAPSRSAEIILLSSGVLFDVPLATTPTQTGQFLPNKRVIS